MKKGMVFLVLLSLVGGACAKKPDLKNTILANEAMTRAQEAKAPILASKEYKIADRLFNQMNTELNNNKYDDANKTALFVIDAANEAIRVARLIKTSKK